MIVATLQKYAAGPIVAKKKQAEIPKREHLTEEEFIKYRSRTDWASVKPITQKSLNELSQPDVFFSLSSKQKSYMLLLAFLQKNALPFEITFPVKIMKNSYPVNKLNNFLYFDQLYDRTYTLLFPMDKEKQSQKESRKVPLFRTVLCLWCAGYALKDGLNGIRTVTSEVLIRACKIAVYHKSSLTILQKMLSLDEESSISASPMLSFEEKERNLWIRDGVYPAKSPLVESLYSFVFEYLKNRVDMEVSDDYFDLDGKLLFRYGMQTISLNYWKSLARNARTLAVNSRLGDSQPINEQNIRDIYTETFSQIKGFVSKTQFRVAMRHWLRWLIRTTNVSYNIERVMPSPKRVLTKEHGRVFSMSKAYLLIKTLLDDHTPLIDENNIMDFRKRRACLLLLATAGRPHEIVNLLQNSHYKDSNDQSYIRFHKTKTVRNHPNNQTYEWVHYAPVKADAVKWFNELLYFSPKNPLFFPRENGGDGLTEARVFASKYNDVMMSTSVIWNFLSRIQLKLWPQSTTPYFTPHNLRALHLTYRRIIGDDDVLLERQAGHSHSNSKEPYTQTISAEEVAKFGGLLRKGVWREEKKDGKKPDEVLALEDLTGISSKFEVTSAKLDGVFELTQKLMEESNARFNGKIAEMIDITEISIGGYTHNCNAHILLNCGHTPGHCRACDYYSPDEGSEDAHKADIFREMLHYYFCMEAEKDFKATGIRKMVFQKAADIKERLNRTQSKLWVEKFGLMPNEAKKLMESLFKQAKAFFRDHSKSVPKPSNVDIMRYIKTGRLE